MRRALALPLLSLAACGGAPGADLGDDGPPPRFAVRSVVAPGGLARPLHLVDRETGQPCRLAIRPGEDAARCLPSSIVRVVYRDAGCAEPLLLGDVPEGAWALPVEVAPERVIQVGGPLTDDGAELYEAVRGACVPLGPSLRPRPLRGLAGERPIGDFLVGTIDVDARDAGPAARVLRTVDGLDALLDLVDPRLDLPCTPAETPAGGRCAPRVEPIEDTGLRDPTCARLAVLEYGVPAVVQVGADGPILHMERQDRDVAWAEVDAAGQCRPVADTETGRKTLAFGTPYGPEAWPRLEVASSGGPRLRAPQVTLPDGRPGDALSGIDASRIFVDATLDVACGPAWVQGALRCVPAPSSATRDRTVFLDDRCADPAVEVWSDAAPDRWYRVVTAVGEADLPVAEVYEVGEPAPRRTYYRDRSGGCVETQGAVTADVYRLTRPVAPDMWVELRSTVD